MLYRGLTPTREHRLRRFKYSKSANPLPATFLRGGTSKGIFLNRSVLPDDQTQMASHLPRNHGFLLTPNTADSSTGWEAASRAIVVGPSALDCIDVEYTFVQASIRDNIIDYSGNCGNLSSMVGVFALDEGICALPSRKGPRRTHATIRSFNTDTHKINDTTFPISACATRQ